MIEYRIQLQCLGTHRYSTLPDSDNDNSDSDNDSDDNVNDKDDNVNHSDNRDDSDSDTLFILTALIFPSYSSAS